MTSAYEERHRRPWSLRGEQLAGDPVRRAAQPIRVLAWITWPDGTPELIEALATEWTSRAVHVRWRSGHRIEHEAWVWANAVQRAPSSGGS
ncbi:MAG TPA: hypothetical protein VFP72_11405 [Kineosporiaceae bacterium]|nr:hypothetical protein [Kineosporiaceae bacterium]